MKISLFLLGLVLSSLVNAQVVLSEKTDERFGGYWINVESTQANLTNQWKRKATIADALSLQKILRDCLEAQSTHFFRVKQTPYLQSCVNQANDVSKRLKPAPVTKSKLLTVVFDIDETLLTQWSNVGKNHPEKTTFKAKQLDITLSEKDLLLIQAPEGVMVRPGSLKILKTLSMHPRVGEIFFFSAREDRSAIELTNYFLGKVSTLESKFGGLFGRNHLRFDALTTTPSKDLRIIAPDLKKIIIIDDNPGRVIQKELNFGIPKFNADLYAEAVDTKDTDVLEANNAIMSWVSEMVQYVAMGNSPERDFYPFSTKNADYHKLDWGLLIMKWKGMPDSVAKALNDRKIFHQEYVGGKVTKF